MLVLYKVVRRVRVWASLVRTRDGHACARAQSRGLTPILTFFYRYFAEPGRRLVVEPPAPNCCRTGYGRCRVPPCTLGHGVVTDTRPCRGPKSRLGRISVIFGALHHDFRGRPRPQQLGYGGQTAVGHATEGGAHRPIRIDGVALRTHVRADP